MDVSCRPAVFKEKLPFHTAAPTVPANMLFKHILILYAPNTKIFMYWSSLPDISTRDSDPELLMLLERRLGWRT
uniref:Uncharacterized protein n=1 Tax=Caenorhabditis japonica TaxID=281687 RepID=A0A8R1E3M0_CAEJA